MPAPAGAPHRPASQGTPGWEGAGGPARSRVPGVLLGLLVVVGVALLIRPAPLTAEGDGELPLGPAEDEVAVGDVDGRDPAGVDEVPAGALAAEGGRWVQLEPAPVRAPAMHHAVWTGTELIVIGREGEVGAYDAVNRLWWTRTPVPGAGGPRWSLVPPVWTGAEVLVVSGEPGEQTAHAFDPVADAWRRLADPPATVTTPAVSVWAGDVHVLWGAAGGSRIREDGPAVGGVYDPATDSWRRLGNGPVLNVATVAGVATDSGVIVWGREPSRGQEPAAPFAARFVPGPDRWEPLPAPPLEGPASAAAAWTGACPGGAGGSVTAKLDGAGGDAAAWVPDPRGGPDSGTSVVSAPSPVGGVGCGQVLLWGRPLQRDGPRGGAAGAVLDLQAESWQLLPTVPGFGGRAAAIRASGLVGAWTGDALLVAGGSSVPAFLSFDGGWSSLPERGPLRRPAVAWTGEELLVWGGIGPNGPSSALRAWRP